MPATLIMHSIGKVREEARCGNILSVKNTIINCFVQKRVREERTTSKFEENK